MPVNGRGTPTVLEPPDVEAPEPLPVGGWLAALPYPVRSVLRRWHEMVGMIVGVGIALGVGMGMLGVNTATLDIYTREFRLSDADFRVIAEGGTLVPLLPSDSPGTIKRASSVLAQIRVMPGVTEAVGIVNWELERERPGPRRTDEIAELVAVMAVDGEPENIPGTVVLEAGRWLRRNDELVVGPRLGREKGIALSDTIRLGGRDFLVVGIGKLRGFGWQGDSVAYLERQSLRQRTDVGDLVNMIAVDTTRPEVTRARLDELDGVAAYDVAQAIALAEKVLESDRVTHWVVVLMVLGVAGLFVNNMLSSAIESRRLELATLRAIGVPARTILLTIAGEAFVICVVASVVGLALSTLFGYLINRYVAPAYGIDTLYATDVQLLLVVATLAMLLGVAASLGPARRATRVDPVEVLREA